MVGVDYPGCLTIRTIVFQLRVVIGWPIFFSIKGPGPVARPLTGRVAEKTSRTVRSKAMMSPRPDWNGTSTVGSMGVRV